MVPVTLFADRNGHAHDGIEHGLKAMGVPYRLVFTDDDPGCVSRYGIARAPCLVIDDHIVYHGSMSEPDLGVIFAGVRRGGKNGPANIYSVCTNESSGGEPCGMTV